MADDIPFRTEMDFTYGAPDQVTPLIRRVVCNNPGPFTLYGTNSYIVGQGTVAIIDPGPDEPDHIAALLRAVEGETVSHILCTHTHHDHSPAAKAIAQETGATTGGFGPHHGGIRISSGLGEEADYDYDPELVLKDGDRVSGPGWTLRALHTPGHTSNHLCFLLEESGDCFTGDHVMGWNTSVISPPDGNMKDYMESLRRCREEEFTRMWSAHGPVIDKPRPYISAFIAHRQMREDEIAKCIADGKHTIPEMVAVMYADKPANLHKAAARSVLSHLEHMVATGRATCAGETTADARYALP